MNIELFDGWIMDYAEISCSKCGHTDTLMETGSEYAGKDFYKLGWRPTETDCYCPKCAKKYLKPEKDAKKKK